MYEKVLVLQELSKSLSILSEKSLVLNKME